jgi:acetyl esterase/lipase
MAIERQIWLVLANLLMVGSVALAQQAPAGVPREGASPLIPAMLSHELEMPIWNGVAPGSEDWTQTEQASGGTVRNVVKPTMTAYLPDPGRSNGTAAIVCPGGAFVALAMEGEGSQVARLLNERGFTAFVLKYRLRNASAGGRGGGRGMRPIPRDLEIKNANANPAPDDLELANVVKLATSDGNQAIKIVRQNAANWKIDPQKIGVMGFSAGGGVAVGSALVSDAEGKPNFVATLYGPALVDVHVPDDAPPLFMAVAADHMPVSAGLVALYTVWKSAGKSAELHVYSQGRAGFGVRRQGLPSDSWIDRYFDWMRIQGFIPAQ